MDTNLGNIIQLYSFNFIDVRINTTYNMVNGCKFTYSSLSLLHVGRFRPFIGHKGS